ncbi:chondroitin AC/alginate lyase [Xylogone sp. PMI_703]|nr:chondroitin AC/alginate lyase [Xylogone sp. PMI_703]
MKLSQLLHAQGTTSLVVLLTLFSGAKAAAIREGDLTARDPHLPGGYPPHPHPHPPSAPIPTTPPKKWVHPGVYVDTQQLNYVAERVRERAEPWSKAFDSMLAYNISTPTRTANPRAVVECGPTSTPNLGCYDEREDSMVAYTNALAWWITKRRQYAEKAIYYMDAWSSVLQGHNNSNAPLQAAWSAANWGRAAEIIRYSNAGWKQSSVKQFEKMLTNVYLPIIIGGNTKENGNWELVMMESSLYIAVFTENKTIYETAMSIFAQRVPAYIYLKSDGPLPVPARGIADTPEAIISYWWNQSVYPVDGITQETCRDFAHLSYGISSISHIAETSRIQGKDIWKTTDTGRRIKAALELHAPFETGDATVPKWLCNGTISRSMDPVAEPPYNALAFRLGESMPATRKLVLQQRPAEIGEPNPLFIGFETVTNAGNPF